MRATRSKAAFRWCRGFGLAAALLLLNACDTVLPRDETVTASPWATFAEAKAAYEKIAVDETTGDGLRKLGFDPYRTPNATILSYLDVTQRFTVAGRVELSELEPAVRDCIAARTLCKGFEFQPESLRSKRTGNALLDVFGFRRHTIRKGWRFNALILLNRDLVVYKLWRGTPMIHKEQKTKKPLGPIQDAGGLLRDQIGP